MHVWKKVVHCTHKHITNTYNMSNKTFTPTQHDDIARVCRVYNLTQCLISPNEIGCEIGEHKNLYNINIKGVCMSVNKEDNLCLFYV